jgi:hypothetical protein
MTFVFSCLHYDSKSFFAVKYISMFHFSPRCSVVASHLFNKADRQRLLSFFSVTSPLLPSAVYFDALITTCGPTLSTFSHFNSFR